MYQEKKFGALSSSVDPTKLAATVQGILKALAGALAFFGYASVVGDINSLAEQTVQIVTLGYAVYGAAETVYGIIRKIIAKLAIKE
jgi:hypothetical protein